MTDETSGGRSPRQTATRGALPLLLLMATIIRLSPIIGRGAAGALVICVAAPAAQAQEYAPSKDRVVVSIRRSDQSFSEYGFRKNGDALVSLDRFVLLGLDPRFDPKQGTIQLRAPGWLFRARLGSTRAELNGRAVALPVSPRLQKVRVSYEVSPVSLPLAPIVAVAKLRGHEARFVAELGDLGPAFILRSPDAYAPIPDFKEQRLASPALQRSGKLNVELSFSITGGEPVAPQSGVHRVSVMLRVTNTGDTPYLASDRYVFLEMEDGSVLKGEQAAKSTTARDLSVVVEAGQTRTLRAGPWPFRADYRVPIRRILYMDGRERFEWRIDAAMT